MAETLPPCNYSGCDEISVRVRQLWTGETFQFCSNHDPLEDEQYADYWA